MTAPKATRDPAEQYRRKREGLHWPQVFPPAFKHRAKPFQQRPLATAPQGLQYHRCGIVIMAVAATRMTVAWTLSGAAACSSIPPTSQVWPRSPVWYLLARIGSSIWRHTSPADGSSGQPWRGETAPGHLARTTMVPDSPKEPAKGVFSAI